METRAAQRPRNHEAIASAGTWQVDAAHSRLEFVIRHIMVATVRGRFSGLEGTLSVDGAGVAQAAGTVAAATVDTGDPRRDASLRSPDFFAAERFPAISFASSEIYRLDDGRFRIVGALTIRDVTRPIELDAVVRDGARPGRTGERICLALRAHLSHGTFGVGRRTLAAHGVVLGDRVAIGAEISLVRAEHVPLPARR